MIVDESGNFLSQRSNPEMTGIKAQWLGENLVLDIESKIIEVSRSENRLPVTVWRDQVNAQLADPNSQAVISDYLGQPARLVFMDDISKRSSNPDWANTDVSFADGYPFLIANTASLHALNSHMDYSVSMQRFRPNIVIDHDTPWAEDSWQSIRVGDIVFDLVKPSSRCEMTNLDPESGEKTGDHVTRALAQYRRSGDRRVKGVLFGWNAVARSQGSIQIGDPVEIIETREPWPIG